MGYQAKKYCRYCAFCFEGDGYYCSDHDKPLRRIDRATNCKDFALSELGDVITGRQYKPREKINDTDFEQLGMEGLIDNAGKN